MSGPEPGWYPDPDEAGAARYWDGVAWTPHVHPLASPDASDSPPDAAGSDGPPGTQRTGHADPSGPPPPPPPPTSTPTAPASSIRSSRASLVIVVVAASIVLVGALGVLSFVGSTRSLLNADPDATLDRSLPTEQREVDPGAPSAAGCVEVDPGDGEDRSHFELAAAPPPSEIYEVPLPAWGPHTAHVLPETPIPVEPLDIRILLHNLEHGAVVLWFDEDAIDVRDLPSMTGWMSGLRANGFSSASGSSIFISPAPANLDIAAVSLRAWGVAVDCPSWDPAVADAFVAAHYGSRGQAPEASLGPYPQDGPLTDP